MACHQFIEKEHLIETMQFNYENPGEKQTQILRLRCAPLRMSVRKLHSLLTESAMLFRRGYATAASFAQSKEHDGDVQAEEKAGNGVEPIQLSMVQAMYPIPAQGVLQQDAENQREVGDDHEAAGFRIELTT
jgi:hypothetical protein